MKESMAAILSPEITLSNKLVAFDNFEQLIESLDNANNMEPLGLWTPLVDLLGNEEAELRKMAAWCVGTAVQNNVQSQERVCIHSTELFLKRFTDGTTYSYSSSTAYPPWRNSPWKTRTRALGEKLSTPSQAG